MPKPPKRSAASKRRLSERLKKQQDILESQRFLPNDGETAEQYLERIEQISTHDDPLLSKAKVAALMLGELWQGGHIDSSAFTDPKELEDVVAPLTNIVQYVNGAIQKKQPNEQEAFTDAAMQALIFPKLCGAAEEALTAAFHDGSLSISDDSIEKLDQLINDFKQININPGPKR